MYPKIALFVESPFVHSIISQNIVVQLNVHLSGGLALVCECHSKAANDNKR